MWRNSGYEGADLESKDEMYGQTPLSLAETNEHEALAKMPLEKGADINVKGGRGGNALYAVPSRDHEAVNVMEPEHHGGDECISVQSNNGDRHASCLKRIEPEIPVVRQFGSFFAELEELRPLHKRAFSRLGAMRFQENYRRIFKRYVLRLQDNARILVEKDIVLLMRSRTDRLNIARRILSLIQADEEGLSKPSDKLVRQPVEELMELGAEGSEHISEESEDETDIDERRFPSIVQAKKFLRTGFAFQMLVHDLSLLILPPLIRAVVEHTPKDSIRLFSENDISLIIKFKVFVEDSSNIEWDWWPLAPRVPDLPSDKMHLRWTVSVLFATIAGLIVSLIQCSFVDSIYSWRSPRIKLRYCSKSWNPFKTIRWTVIDVSHGLFQVIESLISAACTSQRERD